MVNRQESGQFCAAGTRTESGSDAGGAQREGTSNARGAWKSFRCDVPRNKNEIRLTGSGVNI